MSLLRPESLAPHDAATIAASVTPVVILIICLLMVSSGRPRPTPCRWEVVRPVVRPSRVLRHEGTETRGNSVVLPADDRHDGSPRNRRRTLHDARRATPDARRTTLGYESRISQPSVGGFGWSPPGTGGERVGTIAARHDGVVTTASPWSLASFVQRHLDRWRSRRPAGRHTVEQGHGLGDDVVGERAVARGPRSAPWRRPGSGCSG